MTVLRGEQNPRAFDPPHADLAAAVDLIEDALDRDSRSDFRRDVKPFVNSRPTKLYNTVKRSPPMTRAQGALSGNGVVGGVIFF